MNNVVLQELTSYCDWQRYKKIFSHKEALLTLCQTSYYFILFIYIQNEYLNE